MTALSPASVHLPVTQLGLKRESWLISGDGVYHNGVKTRSRYMSRIVKFDQILKISGNWICIEYQIYSILEK